MFLKSCDLHNDRLNASSASLHIFGTWEENGTLGVNVGSFNFTGESGNSTKTNWRSEWNLGSCCTAYMRTNSKLMGAVTILWLEACGVHGNQNTLLGQDQCYKFYVTSNYCL